MTDDQIKATDLLDQMKAISDDAQEQKDKLLLALAHIGAMKIATIMPYSILSDVLGDAGKPTILLSGRDYNRMLYLLEQTDA